MGAPGAGTKTNWQDGWRFDLDDCERKKKSIFTGKDGKPITRQLGEMSNLMVDHMINEQNAEKAKKKPKPKPKPKNQKLTKKERMKLELMGHIAPGVDDAMASCQRMTTKSAVCS